MRSAVNSGYALGFKTILDANILTMLTAVVLFIFATAQPKGFAVTLILGVIVSMFTAVLFTRAILGVLAGFAFFNRPSLMGVSPSQIAGRAGRAGECEPRGGVPQPARRRHDHRRAGHGGRRRGRRSRSRRAAAGAAPQVHLQQAQEAEVAVSFFRRLYQFDYMGHKTWWFAFSGVLIAVSLVSLAVNGLDFGLEFQEGTRITVSFESPPPLGDLRDAVSEAGYAERADPADRQRVRRARSRASRSRCRCSPTSSGSRCATRWTSGSRIESSATASRSGASRR